MSRLSKVLSLVLVSTSCFLTGCASIVNGTQQKVSVDTGNTQGAHCALSNDKGQWEVNTPGTVNVHRSYSNLVIDCKKMGYQSAEAKVASKTKAMAFGNIVFGGAIGAGVDMANGSAYDYPELINVPMRRA